MAASGRTKPKHDEGKASRKGPTFRFIRRLPDGMTAEEATRRCEQAFAELAEGKGR
jgi:hypothetical protein